jgi:hypothetical protein
MSTIPPHQPHKSRVHPPSEGIIAWTLYFMAVGDWVIDAKRRSHLSNGRRRSSLWRYIRRASIVASLVVLSLRIAHVSLSLEIHRPPPVNRPRSGNAMRQEQHVETETSGPAPAAGSARHHESNGRHTPTRLPS